MRDLDSIPTTARDLTVAEAAAFAGVKRATIRQWVHRGILTPAFRTLGGHARFALLDVAKAEARTRAGLAAHGLPTRRLGGGG